MRPSAQTAQLGWPNIVTKVQLTDSLRCPRRSLVAPRPVIPDRGDNHGRSYSSVELGGETLEKESL
jgi:hypothetical protein